MLVGLLIYTIPICSLLFVLIYKPARKYYVTIKTVASITFLCLAIYYGISGENTDMLFHMLPGFIMCLFGDIFLGIYNGVKNKRLFLAGVATFLLGHVFFIAAMLSIQELSILDFIFPVCAIGITMFTTYKKHMFLGKLRPYVYIYSFFVAMLFSKSLHILYCDPGARTLCLGLGSTLFLISDFLILFLYFYDKRPWSTHGWNLVTYYYGIFLLAVSLLYS